MRTFNDLCEIEPGLVELRDRAASIKDDGTSPAFCANHYWYNDGLRLQLSGLVGWGARNPAIKDDSSYDVAYQAIYAVLPNCRNCICFQL